MVVEGERPVTVAPYNSNPDTGSNLPSTLTGLTASDGTSAASVLLTWNSSQGATSYDVYFSTTETGSRTFISSTASNSMSITGATPRVIYYYFVFPVNSSGSGSGQWNTGYIAEPPPPPNVAPTISIIDGNRTVADSNGSAGELVSFSATASDGDGSIAASEWVINDAVVATGLSTNISLLDGVTEVTFRATDDDGASSSTNVSVTVQAPAGAPEDEWPAPYNGITPDETLGLSFNNISVYNPEDQLIYACLRLLNNGESIEIDGVGRFDIALEIVSIEEAIIRITRFRAFNDEGALNEFGQEPSCSGSFETTLNIYEDIIQVGVQTLTVTFDLIDPVNLEFKLLNFSEVQP